MTNDIKKLAAAAERHRIKPDAIRWLKVLAWLAVAAIVVNGVLA